MLFVQREQSGSQRGARFSTHQYNIRRNTRVFPAEIVEKIRFSYWNRR